MLCFHTSKAEVQGWTALHPIAWANWLVEKTKLEAFFILDPKGSSTWVKDRKVKDTSINLKEENEGNHV